MVVSGAPDQEACHADKVCHMALDMVDVIGGLTDPSTGESLKIRVGMSSQLNIFRWLPLYLYLGIYAGLSRTESLANTFLPHFNFGIRIH